MKYGLVFIIYCWTITCNGQILPRNIKVIQTPGYTLGGSDIVRDQYGNYWFTGRNGMFRYDGKELHIVQDHRFTDTDYAYYNASLSPDGKLWLTCTNNRILSYVDTRSASILHVADTTAVVRDLVAKHGIEYLFADKTGQLWICLKQAGLVRFDPKTSRFDHLVKASVTISKLTEDIHGNIWAATTEMGVFMLNPQTREIKKYLSDPLDTRTLVSNGASAVFQRKNGEIWVGLDNYINIINPATGKVTRLRLYTQEQYSAVRNICEDSKGNMYIAHGRSVYRFNNRDGIKRLDLIPSGRYSLAMLVDSADQLWVGNAEFVSVYNLNSMRATQDLNIIDIDVNGSTVKDNDENYSLTRDARGALVVTIREGDNLSLHYSPQAAYQSYFTFKTRLEMAGTPPPEWMVYQGSEYRNDFHLTGGVYTFRVSSQIKEGEWVDVGYISIIVVTPVWKRWWAIFTYVLVTTLMLLYAYRNWSKREALKRELRRQEAENELWRQVDETKMHFFSNIAHEFRTPLTLILNAAEYVETAGNQAAIDDKITAIQRNTFHVLRLVNQILDLTKKDAGKLTVTETLGDPIALITEIARSFNAMADKKRLDLALELDDGIHTFYFDHAKLEMIIYNLLSNAIKFTPEGGQVVLFGSIDSENILTIKVVDSGIGIEANKLARIFDRFYQLDASPTREFSGTGLGLAVAKEFTELLGGNVEVSSVPRLGTSFTIRIPVRAHQASLPDPAPGAPADIPDVKPGRQPATLLDQPLVVVAEDHDELRSFLVESLSVSYQVIAASNGLEGIKLARLHVPDLIISDVMMPLVDGYELVRTLKHETLTGHIPILMLSAKSSFEDKMQGLEYGADAYLTKPFSLAELRTSISNILATRRNLLLRLGTDAPATARPASPEDFIQERELLFLGRIQNLVLDNMADESFDIEKLAAAVHLSRSQLYRKIHALTQQTASQFIHSVRLEKARKLLLEGDLNVTQVAHSVGYSSQSYFSQVFREHFGHPPKVTTRTNPGKKNPGVN